MAQHERFRFPTVQDLLRKAREVGVELPVSERIELLFQPVEIGGRKLANRMAVHPMEGFDADETGGPSELTFRRYRRYAEGGSALIWFEATAVVPEARSNPRQLHLHRGNVDRFKRLVEETRSRAYNAQDLFLVLQLTHSGRYSKPEGKPKPIIAHHSPILDAQHGLPPDYPLITDDELDRLQERFVEAAQLAQEAGFDAVDIKACHRYLVSELLASFTREKSRYGGSFENRTRFLRETAARIREEVPDILVTSRLSLYDAHPYPYGWGVSQGPEPTPDLSEPKQLIRELRQIGYTVLNATAGNPYYNPHVNRPYDFPTVGLATPPEHPLEGVARLINLAGEIQREFPDLLVVGSGYSWLRHFMPYIAAGVLERRMASLIGQGRGAFAYPDSVRDLLAKGKMDPHKVCVTCSACSQIMRDGGRTGCVVRDNAVYGPEYREARRRAKDVLLREAEKCRECDSPMCELACPAGIDIPGFIKAYARGEIASAYRILTERNLLPEICARVCPVEVLCEGACIENKLHGQPVSIGLIQWDVARQARELGVPAIEIPERTSGRRVAVIGAGPAGLACAGKLVELGHAVDVYERETIAGGLASLVIPGHRLRRAEAEREVNHLLGDALRKGRLHIHWGEGLGDTRPLQWFRDHYDAVFVGCGLWRSVQLAGTTARPEGVTDALEFLRESKSSRSLAVPARVAVIGGGNTAVDAAVVAAERGAREVYLIYRRSFQELPAWPSERDRAIAAGVHFLILSQPVDYLERNGRLVGIKVARTELGEPDASGRRRPVVIRGSEYVLNVDMVIEALGQSLDPSLGSALGGIELTERGLLRVDEEFQTALVGVFAGGDAVNGGSTVVRAVSEGMRAAEAIHAYLTRGSQ
jgi:NADPH-dependent glutamate synthase beta subunit-like oxidoreductase/2,4-dienoyl-CoA reductase-like NADH-dependent reductase (Old Yellow Enzyme family)